MKPSAILHRVSEVSGPTGPEESPYQLSATMDIQDSGRWQSPLGGEASRRPNGVGGRQSGKGSEQVEGCYTIASIKPLAVVKLSAFQRLYFLLSL